MLNNLDATLKAILDDSNVSALVRDAEISFDRPSESYNPDKTTINLFLYDVRENIELRSNEPIIERQTGTATIRRPPIRFACSYLVTVWIESGVPGEQAMLDQHQLLGEVLKVFCRMPTIDEKYLQNELKTQMYPVPLVTVQGELMRNPAEFWSALGGKLRPSITLTATIAMDPFAPPPATPLVSTHKTVLGERVDTKHAAFKPVPREESFSIGGFVSDSGGKALEGCVVTVLETGQATSSTAEGRFRFGKLGAGRYTLSAVSGGVKMEVAVQVPAPQGADYSIQFS